MFHGCDLFLRTLLLFLSATVSGLSANSALAQPAPSVESVLQRFQERFARLATYDCEVEGEIQKTNTETGVLEYHEKFRYREVSDLGTGFQRYENSFKILRNLSGIRFPFHGIACIPESGGKSMVFYPNKRAVVISADGKIHGSNSLNIKPMDIRYIGLNQNLYKRTGREYEKLSDRLTTRASAY